MLTIHSCSLLGNTFRDALAHHRRQQGLQVTTIDVGAVLDVGYVADHADRLAMTKYLGSMMEYAMNPALKPPAQLVTGLTPLETHRSRGVPMLSYMNFPLFTQLRSLNARQGDKSDGAKGLMWMCGSAQHPRSIKLRA